MAKITQGQEDLFGSAQFTNPRIAQIAQIELRNSQISLSRNELRKGCAISITPSAEIAHAPFISTSGGRSPDELGNTKLKLERNIEAKSELVREQMALTAAVSPYWTAKKRFERQWEALLEEEGGFSLSPAQRQLMRSAVATLDPLRASFAPEFRELGRLKSAISILDRQIRSLESDIKAMVAKKKRAKA